MKARDGEPAGISVYRNIMIPMRDRIRLATDIYLPVDRHGRPISERLPILLARSPYGKQQFSETSATRELTARGYAVVVQDKRGCHGSEGQHRLLGDDSDGKLQDGYDTVAWLERQRWGAGNIGMWGISYLGHATIGTALAAPAGLLACVSVQASSNPYSDQFFVDGILSLETARWNLLVGEDLIAHMPAGKREAATDALETARRKGPAGLLETPLLEMIFQKMVPKFWEDPLLHREDPKFFEEAEISENKAARIGIPILHVGGWFDNFIRNTVRQYKGSSERSQAQLIIGPWTHGNLASDKAGNATFPSAAVSLEGLVANWMDYWIKGLARPAFMEFPILIYVMGVNRWRYEEQWPPRDSRTAEYFLREHGRLSPERPSSEPPSKFTYDPGSPFLAPSVLSGPDNLARYQLGRNTLTYTTEPLEAALEIAGEIRVTLFATSDVTDADWVVELHDATPDGQSLIFSEGVTRARYRASREMPLPIPVGEVVRYEITLRPISLVIKAGHALRIVISGGKFPAFERNPNRFINLNDWTEDDIVVANHQVHHEVQYPSCVHLPVLERSALENRWADNPCPLIAPTIDLPTIDRPLSELALD